VFSDTDTAVQLLHGTSFAVEAGDPALFARLHDMALSVGGRPFRLPPGARALYHASAIFAAAAVVGLFQQAIDAWQAIDVDADSARAALLPLLRGTVATLERLPPAEALSGPVARGDVDTIRRHLDAIHRRIPHVLDLYVRVTEPTIVLGLARGTLQPEAAEQLRSLLQHARVPSTTSTA
jgi:predicted short-subunit dehydrogenase-like oxidoreductase (DUF2520 family)